MTLPRKILQCIGGLYDVGILFIFQKFSKCNIGQHLNHKDRTGHLKLLICTEKIRAFLNGDLLTVKLHTFHIIETVLYEFT
jgi:hypothetical protein